MHKQSKTSIHAIGLCMQSLLEYIICSSSVAKEILLSVNYLPPEVAGLFLERLK